MDKINADLVLKNSAVYTVDNKRSWAQAIAISNNKIVFVGTNSEVESSITPDTIVLDLNGRMVLPGFIDAHSHHWKLVNKLIWLSWTRTYLRFHNRRSRIRKFCLHMSMVKKYIELQSSLEYASAFLI